MTTRLGSEATGAAGQRTGGTGITCVSGPVVGWIFGLWNAALSHFASQIDDRLLAPAGRKGIDPFANRIYMISQPVHK